MNELAPPDTHHVSAALGWLELGNPAESEAELRCVSPERAEHPDVLEMWFALHAQTADWTSALKVAGRLVELAPDRAGGWLHRAYAARRAPGGSVQAAWDALLPASGKFPEEPTIPYNLACYAAQLGQLDDALRWFKRALKAGTKEPLKRMALADADLQPLHEQIRKL